MNSSTVGTESKNDWDKGNYNIRLKMACRLFVVEYIGNSKAKKSQINCNLTFYQVLTYKASANGCS